MVSLRSSVFLLPLLEVRLLCGKILISSVLSSRLDG